MVNEFVPLSQKKDDEDCFCRESEKIAASESSDEDTTSSSLIPVPDTLDVMRNELESTINNFGTTEYDGMRKMDLHPTEREVSIVRKITSANLLLDDLLNASTMLPKNIKNTNPLVFNAKTVRQRSSPPPSESSEPTTNTTSVCENHFPTMPVVSFAYPAEVCDCSQYPKENSEPPSEFSPAKKVERKNFLLEKMKRMKLPYRKRGKTLTSDSQRSQPNYPPPSMLHGYTPSSYPHYHTGMKYRLMHPRGRKKHVCAASSPACKYQSVLPKATTQDAKCGNDDALECVKPPDGSGGHADNPPTGSYNQDTTKPYKTNPNSVGDQGTKIPLIPVQGDPEKGKERIDIYYFDHGNSSYYRTTDSHRARFTEYILERTDEYASKFWAEVFGTVTIAIAFIVSFVLQLYRCVFTSLIRALTIGLIQIFSDYFFKPLLTVIFNGLIQPCLILGYNIATSVKDFCIPVCEICEFCAKDLAIIFGSCRLVEVKQRECSPSCYCRHNVR